MHMRDFMNVLDEAVDTKSIYFKRWFANSKVRNRDGSPMICYHGTTTTHFEGGEFHPFSHFGTVGAAHEFTMGSDDAIQPGANIHPVYLSIQKPFETHDGDESGEVDAQSVFTNLLNDGIITQQQWDEWVFDACNVPGAVQDNLRKYLEPKGYDGLAYRNEHEDAGSISWVIFHPSQVWPLYRK